MTRFSRLFIFLMITMGAAQAQPTEIRFHAPDFAGKSVALVNRKDPISKLDSILTKVEIDQQGNSTLVFELNEPQMLLLRVHRYDAPIYASPGTSITVKVPINPKNQLVKTWQKGEFEYYFENLQPDDLNAAIARFDSWYFDKQLKIARASGQSVKEFVLKPAMDSLVQLYADPFYQHYVKYSIAELLLSAGENRQKLYEQFLATDPLLLDNPGWFAFFDLFYTDYFQSFDLKYRGPSIQNRLTSGISPDSLNRLLDSDPFMNRKEVRELVVLKSLAEVAQNRQYPISGIMAWLNEVEAETESETVRAVGANLRQKWDQNMEGIHLPEWSKSWPEKYTVDPKDERPVLLMICDPGTKASEREVLLLQSLTTKYGDYFAVREWNVNEPLDIQHLWPSSYIPNPGPVLDGLGIYSLPHFIWVNHQGYITDANAKAPSDQLESTLFKMKTKADSKNEIKVGQ